jgi:hypothetical protein|tara:strand:- start:354 stop:647 length:294 start_codon:yes stop_codon:yes gene_type:complete
MKTKNLETFIVSCADWSVTLEGNCAEEVATKAFEEKIQQQGKHLKVAPIVEVANLTEIKKEMLFDEYVTLLYCPKVMANAGYHDSAKNFSKIIDEIK